MRRPPLVAKLVAALLAGAALVAAPRAGATLRWGADAEGGAPYVLRDPKDPARVIGFEVELADALSKELAEPIELVQYEFGSLLPGLERGDLDLAMNGLEVTPDRVQRVRFSRPYYVYRLQLVARADDHRFEALEACPTCLVGTLGDTVAERLLDARGLRKRVYDGQVEPYRDLGLGRLDAVLLDVPVAIYWARPDPKLRFVGEPFARGVYAIAFRKDREALAARFDGALARLSARGELERIYRKWGIWDEEQRTLGATQPTDLASESARAWTPRRYLPLLLSGALTTVLLACVSMALAVLLGLPIAVARLWGPRPLRWLATGYVELFRGVPVLLLIFFLYYGLPTLGLQLRAMTAAVLGFGLNYAAYEAEIYRAGIASIPVGQWEAAASLGMGRRLTFRRIILPQAIRVVLPPMTNDFVALFKDTSLVSVIAVVELTKQYQILAKSSMQYLELGLVTAALYLLISVPLGALSRRLEARVSQGAA